MSVYHEFFRYEPEQFLFDFQHGFTGRYPGTVGYTEDVRIDSHGGMTEGGIANHIGCLSADTGQGFQFLLVIRYFTTMFIYQYPAGLDDVLRLAVEQADGLDVFLQALFTECIDGFWGVGDGKQLCRGDVDSLVGCLCRQDDGDEQFEGGIKVELGGGMRVVVSQAREYLVAFVFVHGINIFSANERECTQIKANQKLSLNQTWY